MPYLDHRRKADLDSGRVQATQPGDLTYVLTRECVRFVNCRGDVRFLDLAMVLGCIGATLLEFYRRVVVPYEKNKCRDNGDVYYS